ncbi:hypothetical protein [Nocardia sp. CS682]|uniref:hypothetical protein n=1 Tax=Nocardia sp. CS682 TaxID=1047172 RepID=UPI001074B90A|nr:hypothetical protein [Nocardia sp. CS682]QBS40782.1 hypothetical protein DMB37_12310 [Nocardia sp. CS682]
MSSCWWSEHNEVHQKLFSAPGLETGELGVHPSPAIGCVWELGIIDFERRAWIEHVLAPADGPDLERYLARTLNGVV